MHTIRLGKGGSRSRGDMVTFALQREKKEENEKGKRKEKREGNKVREVFIQVNVMVKGMVWVTRQIDFYHHIESAILDFLI